MPPRNPSLPEGTDHIIDTNIDLGDPGSGGGSGGLGGTGAGGGTGASGGIGGTTGTGTGTGTGGSTAGATGTGTGGGSTGAGGSAFKFDKQGSGGGSGSGGFSGQVREQLNTLKSQAGERARGFADDGKRQATDFLQTLAQVVADAAGSVEQRLGGQYAGVGHKASDSISSLASSLDQRSVDDMIEDARAFVQRSPAAAIGMATVVGFAVARVVRAGVSDYRATSEQGGEGSMSGTGTTPSTVSTGGVAGAMDTGGASGGFNATGGAFGESGAGTAGTGSGTSSSGAGSTGAGSSAPTY